jgi:hypothetical protein
MLKIFFSLLLLMPAISNSQAQSLYIPRNVNQAIEKGTRSPDGKPGKNYWQNFARYDITVSAMPPNRNIQGSEQITYINRSPDTLHSLVIKLIQNIHKPEAPRYTEEDSLFFTSGLHVDAFFMNGKMKEWTDGAKDLTAKTIALNKPLLPNDSIHLSFTWHYQIPLSGGREGIIDSTTFYLAYFYPRVAVYDDYNGWDNLNFTESQEFYNDFNDYSLHVKVPKNFIVWATGTLQNPTEVLQSDYINRLTKSMTSDSTIHIASKKDLAKKNITTQNAINTWTWTANNISDVTVGLSNHFLWDAASVQVDDSSRRRASVQSAYDDTAVNFARAVQIGCFTLNWMSHKLPGIPYPYPKMTIFEGYYDMEYPMIVNDSYEDDFGIFQLIENHEIAHNYFPFYMGTNEARYAFMDEGWATTFEYWMGIDETGLAKSTEEYKRFRISRYSKDHSQDEDLPIITPANTMVGRGYGINAYGKPSLAYLATKDMLGDTLFKKCLQEFMSRWHGKHPIPWDFFNSFNDAAGENLNWFWNSWFFSNNYIDLSIQSVSATSNDNYDIIVRNIGGFPIPFDMQINYADGSNELVHKTPEVWKANQQLTTISFSSAKKIASIKLLTGIFIDSDVSNNMWEAQ